MLIQQQHFRTIWLTKMSGLSLQNLSLQTVSVIDQTKLPHQFVVVEIVSLEKMLDAIKTMQVRGAPLIGAAAAYGVALAMQQASTDQMLQQAAKALIESRPTAVNLAWAVGRMLDKLENCVEKDRLQVAFQEANAIADEDVQCNLQIAAHGLQVIKAYQQNLPEKTRPINILTHCNAGWLATVDIGTALGPIYAAHDAGLNLHVWVDETRPRNQGASLTAWELGQHGVPHTVIADNAGGHLMQHGYVDMVIVGADRVTSTGDVCNKIGTYLKALSAKDNNIPFYVAVPTSTVDWTIKNGLTDIPIEYRDGDEVRFVQGVTALGECISVRILPQGCEVLNPAFDVTPATLITALITEKGIFKPEMLNFDQSLAR